MGNTRRLRLVSALVATVWAAQAQAADLIVWSVTMQPGMSTSVYVSGSITAESTYGLTVVAEIVPREGNVGELRFTSSPPVDVSAIQHPWPGVGGFTPYDTDLTYSRTLNGCIYDNGTFVPAPVDFEGTLVRFPVRATADARGVWDLVLSTSVADSNWEGLSTRLVSATVTVEPSDAVPTATGWGMIVMTLLIIAGGQIVLMRRSGRVFLQ